MPFSILIGLASLPGTTPHDFRHFVIVSNERVRCFIDRAFYPVAVFIHRLPSPLVGEGRVARRRRRG